MGHLGFLLISLYCCSYTGARSHDIPLGHLTNKDAFHELALSVEGLFIVQCFLKHF